MNEYQLDLLLEYIDLKHRLDSVGEYTARMIRDDLQRLIIQLKRSTHE